MRAVASDTATASFAFSITRPAPFGSCVSGSNGSSSAICSTGTIRLPWNTSLCCCGCPGDRLAHARQQSAGFVQNNFADDRVRSARLPLPGWLLVIAPPCRDGRLIKAPRESVELIQCAPMRLSVPGVRHVVLVGAEPPALFFDANHVCATILGALGASRLRHAMLELKQPWNGLHDQAQSHVDYSEKHYRRFR